MKKFIFHSTLWPSKEHEKRPQSVNSLSSYTIAHQPRDLPAIQYICSENKAKTKEKISFVVSKGQRIHRHTISPIATASKMEKNDFVIFSMVLKPLTIRLKGATERKWRSAESSADRTDVNKTDNVSGRFFFGFSRAQIICSTILLSDSALVTYRWVCETLAVASAVADKCQFVRD